MPRKLSTHVRQLKENAASEATMVAAALPATGEVTVKPADVEVDSATVPAPLVLGGPDSAKSAEPEEEAEFRIQSFDEPFETSSHMSGRCELSLGCDMSATAV